MRAERPVHRGGWDAGLEANWRGEVCGDLFFGGGGYDVDVLQRGGAGVLYVVAGGGRNVGDGLLGDGQGRGTFDLRFAAASQDHESFFVAAGGVPADGGSGR